MGEKRPGKEEPEAKKPVSCPVHAASISWSGGTAQRGQINSAPREQAISWLTAGPNQRSSSAMTSTRYARQELSWDVSMLCGRFDVGPLENIPSRFARSSARTER